MASRSPSAEKRRPALVPLQQGAAAAPTAPRRSSLAKRASFNIPSDVSGLSPMLKKKRVSFGGEHIKHFTEEREAEWGESPPFVLEQHPPDMRLSSPGPASNAALSPVVPRRTDSPAPSPRRSPRLRKRYSEESVDVDGDDGDTLTLPHAAEMIQEQANTPQRLSQPPDTHHLSKAIKFMDEDVPQSAVLPRLSVAGGCGEDTTVFFPIPDPEASLNTGTESHLLSRIRQRRESMMSNHSDGDITMQMLPVTGLLDIDEARNEASDGATRESPGSKGPFTAVANTDQVAGSIDGNKCSMVNVTSEAVPPESGLGDFDEVRDEPSDVGIREFPGSNGASSPLANTNEVAHFIDDDEYRTGNVTSEIVPVASLLAIGTDAIDSPQIQVKDSTVESHGNAVLIDVQSPVRSIAGTPGRESIVSITCSVGNVTSEAVPVASLIALSTDANVSPQIQVKDSAEQRLGFARVDELVDLDSSSNPGESEAKTVASCAAEPVALSLRRPVLPESRQLFSSEMQGDDSTIHYHDTMPQPGVRLQAQAQASEVRTISPNDDAGSASKNCKTDGEASESAALTMQVPSVPLRDSQIEPVDAAPPTAQSEFASSSDLETGTSVISDFLEAANVQFREFDIKALRDASLGGHEGGDSIAEEHQNTEDTRRAASFKRVHDAARYSGIVREINESKKFMHEEIAKLRSRVAEKTAKIARDPPEHMKRVIGWEKLSPADLSKMQREVKRIRQVSHSEAKARHVAIRSKREQRMEEHLCQQVATLQIDQGVIRSTRGVLVSSAEQVAASANDHGLQPFIAQVSALETDAAVTQTLRSEVQSGVAALAAVQVSIEHANSKRKGLASENDALAVRNSNLKSEVSSLRNDAQALSVDELKKQIEQRHCEQRLLSSITGVRPIAWSDTKLHVCLLRLVDVHFGLQGNDVNLVTCSLTPRSQPADSECPFEDLVAGAVTSLEECCLKRIRVLGDIRAALQRGVAFLARVLHVQHELNQYRENYEVFYEKAESRGSSAVSGKVMARAEYYSISKHCKFDVVISVLATAPAWPSASALIGDIKIQVEAVDSIVGACPTKEAVMNAISSATNAPCIRPAFDALQGIWKLLE